MKISGNTLEQHIHRTYKHMRDNTNTNIALACTYNMYMSLLRSLIYTIISKQHLKNHKYLPLRNKYH